jgi:hypothetical protein
VFDDKNPSHMVSQSTRLETNITFYDEKEETEEQTVTHLSHFLMSNDCEILMFYFLNFYLAIYLSHLCDHLEGSPYKCAVIEKNDRY